MAGLQDTIYAVATPAGSGGIGILRLSGEKAIEIAAPVIRLRSGRPLVSVQSHRLYHADLLGSSDPRHPARASVLDEALVVVMRAPRSYTAEDVVEIQCHGGAYVLQAVGDAVLRLGARLAEPGEFTKRAFLNGRLDLTQAEAVLDTIQAATAGSLRLAQEQLRGHLSQEVNRLRDGLVGLLAHVEAGIDFTEEDIAFIQSEELAGGLRDFIGGVDRLLQSGREGRILREGATVVIVGRPNVGKSSLMNALLQQDRAIVTPVAGTTRDVLEEVLNIRGLPVRLKDTAGLRQTEDLVEQEGVRRSRQAMEEAQLQLITLDGSAPLTEEDRRLLAQPDERPRLIVVNKSDLPQSVTETALAAALCPPSQPRPQPSAIVRLSAKTGEGLDGLRDAMRRALLREDFEPGDSAMVTRLRHQTSLAQASEALGKALESVEDRRPSECIAMDLRAGIEALGEITGAVTTEDILDRIFRDFCIGK